MPFAFITVERPVEQSQIAEVLLTSDGISGYWLHSWSETPWSWAPGAELSAPPAGLNLPVECRHDAISNDVAEDDEEVTVLDINAVERGLRLFAQLHPVDFERVFPPNPADGDHDASDADTFLQLCLFGEVVFA